MRSNKSWEEHWKTGDTPWDAGQSAPSLDALLARDELAPGRALVPGCGSGYDVFSLAAAGYEATGVDLAASARSRFSQLAQKLALPPARARLLTADFLLSPLHHLEPGYDLIWDYTFYCAIDPALRHLWKERMLALLNPGGTLAMLLFPVDETANPDEGPPFPLSLQRVRSALEPELSQASLERAPKSHPGRENKEWLGTWQRSQT